MPYLEKMATACAIKHLSLVLLLSLITQHVSFSHSTSSFTVKHGESLLCFGVGLKHSALPGVDLPDGAVL
jgi:hypothetical protein